MSRRQWIKDQLQDALEDNEGLACLLIAVAVLVIPLFIAVGIN